MLSDGLYGVGAGRLLDQLKEFRITQMSRDLVTFSPSLETLSRCISHDYRDTYLSW
jgi:hypothetical protein